MSFEQVSSLMTQLGPILDPPAIYASDEEKCWGVTLDKDLTVLIQFDEQKASIVLTCELGAPPDDNRSALYEMLLQMNYYWDSTGGSRMALNRPGCEVVQIFEIPAEGLDAIRLSEIVTSFAETSRSWRLLVLYPTSAQKSATDTPGGDWVPV